MSDHWTRRHVLSFLAGLPAAWQARLGRLAPADYRTRIEADAVVAAMGAPVSAAHIGTWYLEIEPEEADVTTLVRALVGPAQERPRTMGRHHLESMVREDFARGDTVAIGGWILARSEARACALAALLRKG